MGFNSAFKGLTYSTHSSCQILMRLEFSHQIIKKYSNINFYENPSSGSRVVPYGRTDKIALIVAFHNFANTPKMYS